MTDLTALEQTGKNLFSGGLLGDPSTGTNDDTQPPEEPESGVKKVPGKYGHGYVLKDKAPASPDEPIPFRFSERKVDRDDEVVEPGGIILEPFIDNPVIFWGHGRMGLFADGVPVPVGHALTGHMTGEKNSLKQTKKYLDGQILFDPEEVDEFAATLAAKYLRGTLNTVSIGFFPITISEDAVLPGQKGRTYLETELLEVSAVPIPSLRSATARRDFDDLVIKSAQYDHPIAPAFLDAVSNFFDAAQEVRTKGLEPDEPVPRIKSVQGRFDAELAILQFQFANLAMRSRRG